MRDPDVHLEDMVLACERVMAFSLGVSDGDLMDESKPLHDAVLYQLMILGEAARHVAPQRDARPSQSGVSGAVILSEADHLGPCHDGLAEGDAAVVGGQVAVDERLESRFAEAEHAAAYHQAVHEDPAR